MMTKEEYLRQEAEKYEEIRYYFDDFIPNEAFFKLISLYGYFPPDRIKHYNPRDRTYAESLNKPI